MHPALLQQLRNSGFKHTFRSVCKKILPQNLSFGFQSTAGTRQPSKSPQRNSRQRSATTQLPPAAVTWHSRLLTNPHPSLLPSRSHRAASQPRNPVQGRAVRPEFHVSSCRGLVLVSNLTVLLSAARWDEQTGKQRSSFY